MNSHTRRRVLAVASTAAVATAGLAGCLGAESSSSRSHSSTEGRGRTVPDEQATTEPPMLVRRSGSDAERPAIRLAEDEADEADDRSPFRGHYSWTTLVDSASMADRLIADGPNDSSNGSADSRDGSDDRRVDLASFVAETEFDSESLFLETHRVEQCFELSLCYISWQSNEIRTDYGRVVRPYDEQCTADVNVFESRLIRLPVALDADETGGYGSTTRSGRCLRARKRTERDRTDRSTDSRPPTNNGSQSLSRSESTTESEST